VIAINESNPPQSPQLGAIDLGFCCGAYPLASQ
jgi:hypothetical protein